MNVFYLVFLTGSMPVAMRFFSSTVLPTSLFSCEYKSFLLTVNGSLKRELDLERIFSQIFNSGVLKTSKIPLVLDSRT